MTADSIIEEIKQLGPAGQAEVIRFAIKLAEERKLTGAELTRLAERMAESSDPAEVERLRTAIAGGFYGESVRAREQAPAPSSRIVPTSARSHSRPGDFRGTARTAG